MESVGNLVEYHYSTYNIASIARDVTPKVLLYGRGFPPSVKLKKYDKPHVNKSIVG